MAKSCFRAKIKKQKIGTPHKNQPNDTETVYSADFSDKCLSTRRAYLVVSLTWRCLPAHVQNTE